MQYLAAVVGLAALYDLAARFGLSWATAQENVTAIWPPSGIAVAVFLRLGLRFWPGVFAGSLLANLSTSAGLATAGGIALGDTLEGVAAAALLGWTGFDNRLARLPDILRLIVLGGIAAPLIAATNGAAQICLGGLAPWSSYGTLWTGWWLGDGLSIVVITPLLLAWTADRPAWLTGRMPSPRGVLEALLTAAVIAVTCVYAFGGGGSPNAVHGGIHPTVAYAAFPAVLFAAVRFGMRGATTAVLLAAALAIWMGTKQMGVVGLSSAVLQVFVAALAVSALALAAALAERETALAALRRSEGAAAAARALLTDAVDSLRDHFLLYDADDRLLLINTAARNWSPEFAAAAVPGTHVSHLVRVAATIRKTITPETDVEDIVRQRLAVHRNFGTVFERTFGDRWFQVRTFPTSDGGVVVVRTDITELKRQEAALTTTRNLLVESLDALIDGFAIYDTEDRLVLCNKRYREIYAQTGDLFVPGNRFEDIIRAGAERGQYVDAIGRVEEFVAERMAAHRNTTGTIEQQLSDGRWLQIAERRTPSGHTVGIRADITQLKQVIAALQASERKASQAHARLVDAIESLDDGFVLWDADDRLVLSNDAMKRMFPDQAEFLKPGISFAELIERRVRSGRVLSALGREDDFIRARMAHHRERLSDAMEEQHLATGHWVRVRERRTRESGMAVVLTDITKLKQREGELVAARSDALNASRAKSEFLAMMSHELRTPLNVVIGFAEILRDQGSTLSPGKMVDYAGDIYEAGRYLLNLINDVLDLSKAEAGRMELQIGPVSVEDVIGRALRMIRERATQRGLKLVDDIAPGLPTLEADERKLVQILLNLLSNAVKFTPEGGEVKVRAAREGDRLVIAVSDTGIGIAPENIEKALTAFGQVDNLMTRDQTGTGLGLPLAKRLTELHGATLDLESQVDAGTTVTLRFPIPKLQSAAE
jgi:signal transduction histidine kinase/integral membrane sensor domain MASE1